MDTASSPVSRSSAARLPLALAQLVDAEGFVVRNVVSITGMAGEIRRATFRLELANGRSIKGRILEDAESALRVATLTAMFGDTCARVIAQGGEALLEEWVDGVTLDSLAAEHCPLERAGALFAAIHRTPLWGPIPPARELGAYQEQLLEDLDRLPLLTGLDAATARAAARWAGELLPSHGLVGYVHRDFAAENIVLEPGGRLIAIDNSTVEVGRIDEDWGRCWYRWPLAGHEWDRFVAGYRNAGGPVEAIEQLPYWRLVVLARAARFRTELGAGGGAEIAARLADVVRSVESPAHRG